MSLIVDNLLNKETTSLKVCGVTLPEDVEQLIDLGVHALGVNFWEKSKRFISPDAATPFLTQAAGKIARVAVFVNAPADLPRRLLKEGLIDLAQFHGDESVDYCQSFAAEKLPFIKAIGVKNASSLSHIHDYGATALLLDTPAPGVYGGTGEKFDWTHAASFMQENPATPVLLAGGITPENAIEAIGQVRPAVLDVASGSESSPGIKDMDKVKLLMLATQSL